VVARGPEAFADAAEALAAVARTGDDEARRLAFARTHSWASRFEPLAARLGLGAPVAVT
jgi:hypothetical protein